VIHADRLNANGGKIDESAIMGISTNSVRLGEKELQTLDEIECIGQRLLEVF
jgi:hypothetical protein